MPETISTRCCIAGGGPAGMMLGFLLARAGIDVTVLEKHADFLRDFRGDTIHPSTLEVMHELGLLDAFLILPHQEAPTLGAVIEGRALQLVDFSRLPTRCKFIALMPQWDFLDFLATQGRSLPNFHLRMRAEAVGLLREGTRITGAVVETPEGRLEIAAELVIAADGRHSTVRDQAGLAVEDFGVPMDVLWFRLSHRAGDETQSLGRIVSGRMMVTIDRGDYWQCAFVIPKGGNEQIRRAGLDALGAEIARLVPRFADRLGELKSWEDVKLLTVVVNRLPRWYLPGLLCIGDAAHAMSPVAGVGVNYAVQDAVAAANILVPRLRAGQITEDDLRAVQRRREWPMKMMQRVQLAVQNRLIGSVLAGGKLKVPWPMTLLDRFPLLRMLPARLIGLGFRPEHIRH